MTDHSTLPFPAALQALMEKQDLSFRKVAYLTGQFRDPAYTHGYLNQLALGRTKIAADTAAVIAKAAGVEPEYFLEYRQHVAAERARGLVAIVGLDAVMQTLDLAEREIPLRDLEAAVQQLDTQDGNRASSDRARSPKGR